MASKGYIEALLARFPAEQKRDLQLAFQHVLEDFRLGRPEDSQRATNLQAYYFETTTPPTPHAEFEIVHGLGRPPYLLVPVLSLQDVVARVVPVRVTRAADSCRIDRSRSAAEAPIAVLVEA